MEELQVVNNQGNIKTIESMEVANMIGKRHSDLMRDIRTYVKYLNKSKLASEEFFIEADYQDAKNQKRPCYLITKLGCEMCANKLQGQKGVEFTAKYVMKFNEMEQAVMLKVQDSYMIADPIERAKKWIVEETERQQLRLTAERQHEELKALAPKAAFADAVAASPDCILIRELAKILKQNGAPVGEQRLKEKLRQYGYLVKSPLAPDYNMPTQRAMELDIFKIKETTITSSSGSVHVTKTVKVTQKGVQYFVDRYLTGKIILN